MRYKCVPDYFKYYRLANTRLLVVASSHLITHPIQWSCIALCRNSIANVEPLRSFIASVPVFLFISIFYTADFNGYTFIILIFLFIPLCRPQTRTKTN